MPQPGPRFRPGPFTFLDFPFRAWYKELLTTETIEMSAGRRILNSMIDLKNLSLLVDHISSEKGLEKEVVFEMVEQSLASAYKKEYGKRGQAIRADLDPKTGKANFWQVQTVVDDTMIYSEEELAELQEKKALIEEEETPSEEKKVRFNPERHLMVEEAKKKKKDAKPGDTIETKLEPKADFGRIAAQTGKQVILQKIREAEREIILNEFKSKEGELVSGIVQRLEGTTVLIDLGKTLGALPREEQVPGEFYRPGQRLKFFCLQAQDSSRGPQIVLSRAYPKFISKLFELEVPEIQGGTVEIKAITREPGSEEAASEGPLRQSDSEARGEPRHAGRVAQEKKEE